MSKLQVDDIVSKDDNGSVGFSKGAVVTGVATATSFSGNLTGDVTGDVTGNATGLSGSPDITVNNVVAGIITASNFVGVPPGFSELDAALFN